jgi:hypothetical protein
MARSFKKYPCVKDKNKFMHRYANKQIRYLAVTKKIPNGKSFKKICGVNRWDISDWCFHNSYANYLADKEGYETKSANISGIWAKLYGEMAEEMNYRSWYTRYKRK